MSQNTWLSKKKWMQEMCITKYFLTFKSPKMSELEYTDLYVCKVRL